MATKKAEENRALAVIGQEVFDLTTMVQGSEEIQDNLGEIQIILPMIKIIHQGQVFEMPEGNKAESFEAAILDFHRTNSYWPEAFDSGAGVPPVCFSTDSVRPSPFSSEIQSDFCASCLQNKPGSDPKGTKGRACKNKLMLHLVLEKTQLLPYRLSLSAANLMPFSKFISSMVAKGMPWRLCWVEFSLIKAKNSGGIEYSEIFLKTVGHIPADQGAISKRLATTLMPVLRDTGRMAEE